MLSLYRRHLKKCGQKSMRYKRCGLPDLGRGNDPKEVRQKSLELTSWEKAQERIRDWEIEGSFEENTSVSSACKNS